MDVWNRKLQKVSNINPRQEGISESLIKRLQGHKDQPQYGPRLGPQMDHVEGPIRNLVILSLLASWIYIFYIVYFLAPLTAW